MAIEDAAKCHWSPCDRGKNNGCVRKNHRKHKAEKYAMKRSIVHKINRTSRNLQSDRKQADQSADSQPNVSPEKTKGNIAGKPLSLNGESRHIIASEPERERHHTNA